MADEQLLVRLKPLNERKGFQTKVYMIDGYRFLVEKGWYEVPAAVGEKLRGLHQNHYDEESPKLFDVKTSDEAEALDEKEAQALVDARASARAPQRLASGRQRTQALPVNNAGGLAGVPGDLTTKDLSTPINGTQPTGGAGPASDEASDQNDEGRIQDLGRVNNAGSGSPRVRSKSSSAPQK